MRRNDPARPAALLADRATRVSADHCLLTIRGDIAPSAPGQFINVRVGPYDDPLIRRPFSIFSRDGNAIAIIVKIVGRGTALLADRGPGPIDIIGPLGIGFTIHTGARVLLAGGGVGNAPLHYLAGRLAEERCDITYLYGARSRSYIYLPDSFREKVSRFITVTDDGSEGKAGMVTDAAAEVLEGERFDMVYACGPAPMMKAVTGLAAQRGIPVEVSVENYFGCGIGLCSGCTVETDAGLRRACVDGPVFSGTSLRWD